jgi:hypothetical protein
MVVNLTNPSVLMAVFIGLPALVFMVVLPVVDRLTATDPKPTQEANKKRQAEEKLADKEALSRAKYREEPDATMVAALSGEAESADALDPQAEAVADVPRLNEEVEVEPTIEGPPRKEAIKQVPAVADAPCLPVHNDFELPQDFVLAEYSNRS